MGGGKSQTSTSTVAIPPEVLARYNSVNATAEKAAATPFQAYSQDPNAFVAPINSTQQAGINQVQNNMNTAQPYYDTATGMSLAGSQAVNPGQLNTNQYMNPYIGSVVAPTLQALMQQQGQQTEALKTQGIQSGAFGGDRANLAQSQLAGQQLLGTEQAIAPLLSQGYSQAQGVAQQQQAQELAAQQANQARLMQGGQQIAGLGTGAQAAALQGGQAALAAGTVPQQTQQAGLSALYNQFLQQQGYPFQTAQFLANIAEGTGALSGSTTTTTAPGSMFSDERLKEGKEVIGKTFDGQPIYKYRYKGDHHTQIGLMAQDVEKHHPDAVGEQSGYKTVDYDAATKNAASMGGGVLPQHAGQGFSAGGYAGGGLVDSNDWASILQAQQASLPMYGAGQGGLGMAMHGGTGASGYVPQASVGVSRLVTADPAKMRTTTTSQDLMTGLGQAKELGNDYTWLAGEKAKSYTKDGHDYTVPAQPGAVSSGWNALKGLVSSSDQNQPAKPTTDTSATKDLPDGNARGGLVGYAGGGGLPYGDAAGSSGYVPDESDEGKKHAEEFKSMQKTGTAPGAGQSSGLGDALKAGSMLKSGYGAAQGLASGIGDMATGFGAASNAAGLNAALGPEFYGANIALGDAGASAAAPGIMGGIGAGLGEAASGLGSFFSALGPLAIFAKDGGFIDGRHHYAEGGRTGYGTGGSKDDSSVGTDDNKDNSYQPPVIDQGTLDFIKEKEGFIPTPKWDVNALRAGYGSDTITTPEGKAIPVTKDTIVSKEDADRDLARRAVDFQKGIQSQIGPEAWSNLPSGAKTGLTSLAYHHGSVPSEVIDPLKAGDLEATANAVNALGAKWNNGIHASRMAETASLINPAVQYAPTAGGVGQRTISNRELPTPPSSDDSGILGGIGKAASGIGDWYTRNENWVNPLAQGLGAMAASPSRYLGSAILTGIGGAAKASQAQQLQQSEIAKNTMGLINNRYITVANGKYDTQTGQTIPFDQFTKSVGAKLNQIMGIKTGDLTPPIISAENAPKAPPAPGETAPAANAPAPVTSAAAPTQAEKPPAYPLQPKAMDYDALRTEYLKQPNSAAQQYLSDAAELRNQARAALKVPTPENKALAQQNQSLADSSQNRGEALIASALKPQLEASTSAQKAIAEKNTSDYAAQRQAAIDANNRYQQAEQARQSVFNPDGTVALQTGKVAAGLHDFGSYLEGFGVPHDWVASNIQDVTRYEELAKQTPALATEIAKQALGPGNPLKVAEYNKFIEGVPNNQILPQTIKFLINDNIKPQAQIEMDTWNHIKGMNPAVHDVSGEIEGFKKEHQWLPKQEQPQAPIITPADAAAILAKRRAARQQGVQ